MTGFFGLHICLTALAASLLIVPPLRRWATALGALDHPDDRKIHETPTPHVGGVAIFAAFVVATLLYVDFSREVRGILAGAFVVFCAGLADDFHGLTPKKKFAAQILACLVTILVGNLYITSLGDVIGLGELRLPGWLVVPFTVFGVVGVINALNLADGLDGLAGGLSVIAVGAFAAIGVSSGNHSVVALCAGLLGALIGFLRYNAFPAKIFMGDTGSMMLGHILGFLAVALTRSPGAAVKPVVVLMILGLPVIDTVWVMTARLVRGKNPFSPDRTHLHHRFLDLGLEHPHTVLFLYGIALFWVTFALLFHAAPDWVLFSFYTGVCVLCQLALAVVLRRYPEGFRVKPAEARRVFAVVSGGTASRLGNADSAEEPSIAHEAPVAERRLSRVR